MKNDEASNKKINFHPHNIHSKGYDFKALVAIDPDLKTLIVGNKEGKESINFANPRSVKVLNRAILKLNYKVDFWDIPVGYLCPPVPGRQDYLLNAADLLSLENKGKVPKGAKIKLLDIGTGANLIFPILATRTFGWDVLGSEVDDQAIANAQLLIDKNKLQKGIKLRKQENRNKILSDLLKSDEYFDLMVCNPPFHPSEKVAQAGTARKWKNLKKGEGKPRLKSESRIKESGKVVKSAGRKLNFGGQKTELIYPGGELGFIQRMLEESVAIKNQVFWFTTLVSKESHVGRLKRKLEKLKPTAMKVVAMSHGQKSSRFLAWTFLGDKQRKIWKKSRWK